MKKILLSIAVVAGLSATAQNATNSGISGNDTTAGGIGYVFNFMDDEDPAEGNLDSNDLNCISDDALFLSGDYAGYVANQVDSGDGSLQLEFGQAVDKNLVLNFVVGNCGNAGASNAAVDITEAIAQGEVVEMKARVYSTEALSNFFICPVGNSNGQVTPAKSVINGDTAWVGGTTLVANEWQTITWDVPDTLLDGNEAVIANDTWIGANISTSNWSPEGTTYGTGTVTIDWITFGTNAVPNATKEVEAVTAFNVFPNPATDIVNVKFDASAATTIQLIDITGKVVDSQLTQAGAVTTQFSTAGVNAGIYFVNVSNANGATTQKVVIK